MKLLIEIPIYKFLSTEKTETGVDRVRKSSNLENSSHTDSGKSDAQGGDTEISLSIDTFGVIKIHPHRSSPIALIMTRG